MQLSYNQLKKYIQTEIKIDRLLTILTNIGLEVSNVEKFEGIKGSLEGLIIGQVKTKKKHPNADKLSITTIDVGTEENLQIICGAPNVDENQKVVIATVGSTLYNGDEKFEIKKSKIRGEYSLGMICAEKEIGLGNNSSGIMVLDHEASVGMAAKEYFHIEIDTIIEIDLTPNRVDAASHIGVARDVVAYLKQIESVEYSLPLIDSFKTDMKKPPIEIQIEDNTACQRYASINLSGVKIQESPQWLQNRLKAIGLTPVNNVVDVTNYVLHEVGQPLHAFDADKILGGKVIIKTLPVGTVFVTLDKEERTLHEDDLMICNEKEGMCIAGVLGGIKSGVTTMTENVFLESAYFNPVSIRKTAKRHGLTTDSSFRFERGIDPNMIIYGLKRAALLIQEIAGGNIVSDITDIYPNPIKGFDVNLNYQNVNKLIGNNIKKEDIKKILNALEIKIKKESDTDVELLVPPYRVDVKRESDIIEEILRIYGYNKIHYSEKVKSTIQSTPKTDDNKIKNTISNLLSNNGFNEIMTNSLTQNSYYEHLKSFDKKSNIKIVNPISNELNCLRETLLFNGLEVISYNINHKNADLQLYEFGRTYHFNPLIKEKDLTKKFEENQHLSLFLTGNKQAKHWNIQEEKTNFFEIKAKVEIIFKSLNIQIDKLKISTLSNEIINQGLTYTNSNNIIIAQIGFVNTDLLKIFDIKMMVYYADINWDVVLKLSNKSVKFKNLPKYPEVKRDLSLLIDLQITFSKIKEIAFKTEKKLLKEVTLFDVYEGDKIAKGKKSYAINFILQDENKTLTEKQINKVMKQLIFNYQKEIQAEIR